MGFSFYVLIIAILLCVSIYVAYKWLLLVPKVKTDFPNDQGSDIRKSFFNKLMVLVLMLQLIFIFMYIGMLLVKMPLWVADAFWIISGASGIVISPISIRKMNKITFLSLLIAFVGIILMLAFFFSIGISSM